MEKGRVVLAHVAAPSWFTHCPSSPLPLQKKISVRRCLFAGGDLGGIGESDAVGLGSAVFMVLEVGRYHLSIPDSAPLTALMRFIACVFIHTL